MARTVVAVTRPPCGTTGQVHSSPMYARNAPAPPRGSTAVPRSKSVRSTAPSLPTGCADRLRYNVPPMTSDAIALVTEFCAAFGNGKTPAELVEYFTPAAVYDNIPVDPALGHA